MTIDETRTLPVGRILRLLLGLVVTIMLLPFYRGAAWPSIGRALLVAVGIGLLYAAIHWTVGRFVPRINPCLGAVVAVGPLMAVILLGGPFGKVGGLTFLTASLLLAGARADAGCEVMSIPGLLFGRRIHLVCIALSPGDWVERRLNRTS